MKHSTDTIITGILSYELKIGGTVHYQLHHGSTMSVDSGLTLRIPVHPQEEICNMQSTIQEFKRELIQVSKYVNKLCLTAKSSLTTGWYHGSSE